MLGQISENGLYVDWIDCALMFAVILGACTLTLMAGISRQLVRARLRREYERRERTRRSRA